MKLIDVIIVVSVAVAVGLAIFFMIKNAKSGCHGCSGDCSHCNKK